MKKMKFLFLFSLLFLMSCTILSAGQETTDQAPAYNTETSCITTAILVNKYFRCGEPRVGLFREAKFITASYLYPANVIISGFNNSLNDGVGDIINQKENKNNKEIIVPAPANLFVYSLKLPNMIASISLSVNNNRKATPASKIFEDVHLYSLKFPTLVGKSNFIS